MAKYKSALPKLPKRGWFKKGDTGTEVKKLQKALNWANSGRIVAALKVDGIIGDKTVSAVNFYEEIQHLTIDGHFGSKCLARIKSMDMTGAVRACNFAVSVAKDNRFTYGAGQRAHRCGCYFCHTNTGPKKKNKERKGEAHVVKDSHGNGHTYEMTYCCNTFATAAYAHGAKIPSVLKLCQSCDALDFKPSQWTKHGFKHVGSCKKVPFSKLKMGDVILSDSSKGAKYGHVWIYLGADRYVEANQIKGKEWSADAIRTLSGAKANYNKNYAKYGGTNVVRYSK